MGEDINYRLGLDIGIASVGWSVINLDKERIEDLGVRIFNVAENPDGSSLALPRRLARGRRRLLRRKSYRVNRVKTMLINKNILSKEELDNLFNNKAIINVWEARVKALDELISREEFAKILINLSKRRGFKSNRKKEAKEKENGEIIRNIIKNKQLLGELNYRTVGEFVYKEVEKSNDPYKAYRNKEGQYTMCVSRDMIREEIHSIFESQRKFNNHFATNEIEDEYLKIFDSQRPFSKLEDLEKMVGYCTFEKKKYKRAPKHSISAEEFILYDNINKLYIVSNGTKRKLNNEERKLIVKEAYRKKEIKYSALRKLLSLSDEELFSTLTYNIEKDISKTENTKFVSMNGYYEIRMTVEKGVGKEYWQTLSKDRKKLNDIAYVLTLAKTDDEIKKHLLKKNIEEKAIEPLLDISFSKFNNLSIEALEKILPFVKEGYQYNESCEKAGYNFKAIYEGSKSKKLPVIEIDEIVNPVVIRSLAQTRKVINAVIDRYGSPVGINIELARDLAKNSKDRKMIKNQQEENRVNVAKIREELKSLFGKEPTAMEVLKYRLWKQQMGCCAYSQQGIPIDELFTSGLCEIDHIIPFSRSFDDSLANKVLVLGVENRRKGNRTPYEYIGGNSDRWNRFEVWVNASRLGYKKRNSLLKKKFSPEEINEWKSRNLNDTRYITKFIANFIANRLEFKSNDRTQKVITVNGRATAYLRAKWGLIKVRENGDKHHALDASVVAVVTQGLVQRISKYSKSNELKYIGFNDEFVDMETCEIVDLDEYRKIRKELLPRPWRRFSEELKLRLSEDPQKELEKTSFESYDQDFIKNVVREIFVSRVPIRKIGGRFFKETIYSKKEFKENGYITKRKLTDLKKEDLDNIYNYNCDRKLYDAIVDRMEQFNYDAKKAFSEEFRKPTRDGSLGPIVKGIKVITKVPFNEGIEINKGLVAKDGMIRIDIYEKDGKYFSVPVYRYQLAIGVVPKKAALASKSEELWPIMTDEYKFKFSIYKNDLIKIDYNKKQGFFGYYNKFNRNTASITIESHDNSNKPSNVGIKSDVKIFEKYEVDVLGRYKRIKEVVK